jgi:hypothetical protein
MESRKIMVALALGKDTQRAATRGVQEWFSGDYQKLEN